MFTAVLSSQATANALSLTLGHQLFLKAKLKCGAFAWQKEGQLQAGALLPVEDEENGICPGVTESARGHHYYTDRHLYLAAGSQGGVAVLYGRGDP